MNKYQALGMALCIVSAILTLVGIVAFVPIKLLVDTIALIFIVVVIATLVEFIYFIMKGPDGNN